ncbi:hypothetical protein GWK47_023550 [Chionoecetes opilio]|uniref:Uncharacterized protein n=1 Tax=Chionoecetes opilio TaxID=41210 RepID=A0A8J4XW71_CHIOP|nr:hypothetical protein GWK47_023550 [Chionoecetes opilio]
MHTHCHSMPVLERKNSAHAPIIQRVRSPRFSQRLIASVVESCLNTCLPRRASMRCWDLWLQKEAYISGNNCEAQGCSVSLGPRPKLCSSHAPCLLSDLFVPPIARYAVDGFRLILPEGGVPCFSGEAYADLKEWWSKALKSRQRSPFRLSGRTGLGFSAGPRQVVHLPSSSPPPDPCLGFHESASIVRRWSKIWRSPQSLTMTATPQIEDLPGGGFGSHGGQASPGALSPNPTPVPPGLSAG